MTLLATLLLLVAGHFFCDFSLQTTYMATGKNPWAPAPGTPWWWPMTAHCAVHGGAVGIIIGLMTHDIKIAMLLGCCEFVLHFATDVAKCRKLFGYNTDQMLHLGCKAFYVCCLALAGVAR